MNVAIVNEENSKDSLISMYERELQKLKGELLLKEQIITATERRISSPLKESNSMHSKAKTSFRTNSLCDSFSPERNFGIPSSEKEQNYKMMILKQRDIMVALSERLNERDQMIEDMKEEMRAYDQYSLALENRLEETKLTNIIQTPPSLNQLAEEFLESLKVSNANEVQESKSNLRRIVVHLNKII